MKFKVTLPKPRNPFAPAARQRTAGVHRRSHGGLRQRMRMDLRRTLQEAGID